MLIMTEKIQTQWKKCELQKKNQMEILELKRTRNEMKNSLHELQADLRW